MTATTNRPAETPFWQRQGCRALSLAGLFLVLSLFWRLFVEVGAGLIIGVQLLMEGVDFSDPEVLQEAVSVELMALATILQLGGLGLLAGGITLVAKRPLQKTLGLTSSPVVPWLMAGVGGLTVGFLPGWITWHLADKLPDFLQLGNLDMLVEALLGGSLLGQVLMIVAICVFAPLFEEIVFRGFLWDTLDEVLPTGVVWLVTSGLFALYHVDPIHVMGVLFTGLFLGWLRWAGGGIGPAILAHFVNNTLATAFVFLAASQSDAPPPWWAALASLVVTVLLAGFAWLGRKRKTRDQVPTSAGPPG